MDNFIGGVLTGLLCVLLSDVVSGFYNAKFTDSELRCLKAKANFPEYSFGLVDGMCVWKVSPSVYNLVNDARAYRLVVVKEETL